ncbi:MAG: hypothetical protein AAF850_07920 [Pseudomonadota bacterium]
MIGFIRRLSSFGLSLTVLGIAVGIVFLLIVTKSSPQPRDQGERSVIVQLQELQPKTTPFIVDAVGVARAQTEADIQAQVAGRIASVHPMLRIGGVIPAGEAAVTIEADDYEANAAAAAAAVARARAALSLELGRRKVAEQEAALVADVAPDLTIDAALALREPQLADARAALAEALSTQKTADLNLQRTEISFPFDALVIAENADIGDFATVGATLGSVADVSTFWVEAEAPQTVVQRLRVRQSGPSSDQLSDDAGNSSEGAGAIAAFPALSDQNTARQASLLSVSGSVSEASRLGIIIAAIDDPLALESENVGAPPILLGAYIKLRISVGNIEDVFEAPAAALRENDLVAVRTAESRLAFRQIELVQRVAESAFIRGDFVQGDALVVSRLATAIPGTLLVTPDEAQNDRSISSYEEELAPTVFASLEPEKPDNNASGDGSLPDVRSGAFYFTAFDLATARKALSATGDIAKDLGRFALDSAQYTHDSMTDFYQCASGRSVERNSAAPAEDCANAGAGNWARAGFHVNKLAKSLTRPTDDENAHASTPQSP